VDGGRAGVQSRGVAADDEAYEEPVPISRGGHKGNGVVEMVAK
jgi:hypothetical protein